MSIASKWLKILSKKDVTGSTLSQGVVIVVSLAVIFCEPDKKWTQP